MAQKKISDLTLRSDFDGTCNLPVDDATQTWRVTGAQILAYAKSNRNPAVTSKTANYTVTADDDIILGSASGGAFTLTLPAAASNVGKRLHLKKTDSTLNAVTIDPNASETIDGAATTTLNTQNEAITIISDGTNWQIIDRKIPSEWSSGLTFTTTGAGTISNLNAVGRRVGKNYEGRVRFTYGTGTAVDLKLNLPTGIAIDYSVWGAVQRQVGAVARLLSATNAFPGSSAGPFIMIVDGSDTASLYFSNATTSSAYDKMQGDATFASGNVADLFFSIPVVGWNG